MLFFFFLFFFTILNHTVIAIFFNLSAFWKLILNWGNLNSDSTSVIKIFLLLPVGLSGRRHELGGCSTHGPSPLGQHAAASPLAAGEHGGDLDQHLVDRCCQHLPGHREHHVMLATVT